MKLSEIKIGEYFNIFNTPSYPKIRTSYGYIDVRDEIKKPDPVESWSYSIMSEDEVLKEFQKYNIYKKELRIWKERLLAK